MSSTHFAFASETAVVDIAVIGRGPIGAAAALMAEHLGLTVAWVGRESMPLVEQASGPEIGRLAQWDSRVYALSAAARGLLGDLRVWDALAGDRIAPVYDMRIYPTGTNPVELHFGAYEGNTEALAWIVEGSNLNSGLRRAIDFSRIRSVDAHLDRLEFRVGSPATLGLDDGSRIQARLVIGADGADSVTRQLAGLTFSAREYPQTAVVANFSTSIPHADCAFQWFGEHGVMALLPLPGHCCSLVWSAPHALAAELMAINPQALSERVQIVSAGVLGELHPLGSAASFVLRRIDVPQMVSDRIVLVGDAAHVIHPLAGQGMNLGFADVAALGKVLKARESFRDLGDRLLLRRYERSRKESVRAMTLATDGLQRLFDDQELARLGPLSAPLTLGRDIGWSLLARSSWLKRQLMGLAAT